MTIYIKEFTSILKAYDTFKILTTHNDSIYNVINVIYVPVKLKNKWIRYYINSELSYQPIYIRKIIKFILLQRSGENEDDLHEI